MFRFTRSFFSILMLSSASLALSAAYAAAAGGDSVHAAETSLVPAAEAPARPVYQCPMHPQIISDKPGECPICHMRLVRRAASKETSSEGRPVPGSAVEGHASVTLSEAARDQVGIRTETVKKRRLQKSVEARGEVVHDPELYQLQIDYLREERLNFEKERNKTPRSIKRGLTGREKIGIEILNKGLSAEWIRALETSGVPDKRLLFHHNLIRALDQSDVLDSRFAQRREDEGVWIYLELLEQDVPFVEPGDVARMDVISLPGTRMEGRVEFIDNKVQDETRTLRARVLVKDVPANLKPMMRVSASLTAELGEAVAIPDTAPLFTGKRAIVWIDEEGRFVPREVTLGRRAEGYYEVLDGVHAGEKIAVAGNFFIDSESRLKSVLESAVGLSAFSHEHAPASSAPPAATTPAAPGSEERAS